MNGPEARVIYLGMDQSRDELLFSNIKGRNPFKDIRVREAIYRAIDTGTIREKIMRGAALPAGTLLTETAFGHDPSFSQRTPFDIARARKLMEEAGYPDGFEVTLDCSAGRYVNDDKICAALAPMLARIKIKLNVLAQAPNLISRRSAAAIRASICMGGDPTRTPAADDDPDAFAQQGGSRIVERWRLQE